MPSVATIGRPVSVRLRASRSTLIGVLVLCVACVPVEGCSLFDRPTPAQRLARIPGVASLTFDGIDVVATTGAPDESTRFAVFSQTGPAAELRLRVGDAFLVTDRASMSVVYELIRAGEDELLFRAERRTLISEEPGGVRKTTAIVAVKPYEAPGKNRDDSVAPREAMPKTPD
ncbi:MAG: hypothetical protein D6744_04425 [Planctomycetota bacterium]|nr:MAG: hypothetical protein D6744_04425 [Planctomycetota bacterium]